MIIILIFDVDPDYWFQMMPDVDNVVGVMTQCLSGVGVSEPNLRMRWVGAGAWAADLSQSLVKGCDGS